MKPRMMQRSAPHLERGGTIPISRMVRALVASSALLSICGCGGNDGRGGQDGGPPQIGGAPPDGGPRPDGEPPVEPDVTGTVDVTAVDVFGAPLAGAWISLHSNSPYQQAIADTDGRATFRKIRPGVVDASANTLDKAFVLPLVRWTGGLGRRSASGLRFVLHGRPVAERRMSPA